MFHCLAHSRLWPRTLDHGVADVVVVVVVAAASVPDVVTLGPGNHGVRDGGEELSLGRLQRLPFHSGCRAVGGLELLSKFARL